jgi:hypothetical protein
MNANLLLPSVEIAPVNSLPDSDSLFLPNHVVSDDVRLLRKIDAAKNYVEDGYLARGVRSLMNQPVSKHSSHETKMNELRSSHPQNESIIP